MGSRTRKKKLTHEEINDAYVDIETSHNENILKSIHFNLKAKTQNQKELIKLIREKDIIICSGFPGTGKTYVACAMALELLKKDPKYKKIVIVKSVTPLKDEEVGYLKGTLREKLEPFMYSFIHNFEKIIGKDMVEKLKINGFLEEMPLTYMRGINIDNAIVIIDEAQNIKKTNMKTIMTLLGEDSKMIFLGDEGQIDLKNPQESSLSFIIKRFKEKDFFGTIAFGEEDIVRHHLIKIIEQGFDEINYP